MIKNIVNKHIYLKIKIEQQINNVYNKGEDVIYENYIHSGGLEEGMGMAVDEMIKREKARLRREGRREGEIAGIGKTKIEVAKKLLEINMSIKQIKEITGITEEELKAYK